MNRLLSVASGLLYRYGCKPILFRMSPDAVHSLLVRYAPVLHKQRPISFLLGSLAYRNEERLSQTIDGIYFPNPVGIAAGFDKNGDLTRVLGTIGFGFVTVGSVTAQPCDGNPKPWFHRLPKARSLVVHVGLANRGAKNVLKAIDGYPRQFFAQTPLVLSVAKTNLPSVVIDSVAIEDYLQSVKLAEASPRVRCIEVNISCPNTYGGEPFTTPKRLQKLLRAIQSQSPIKPIWLKMPINLDWPAYNALVDVALSYAVTTFVVGNLNKNRNDLASDMRPPDEVLGNLSGKPTQQRSNDLIKKMYQTYGSTVTIVGVGGISSAEDAYEKIRLGASVVGLITGLIFEGPQLVGNINHNLVQLLERDGFTNISEAVGSYHRLSTR
ncbi:MAG: dihydroorotate dehydrogenase [Patescibacteria group bacterium]|nr:quinone-dependent dihydroorotate dehydrogenase [Candidatus Saccharibacteria bacterium]MDQ5963616.1 dihydroorotate dehydrogenase [Patescibacteria group bacterium]